MTAKTLQGGNVHVPGLPVEVGGLPQRTGLQGDGNAGRVGVAGDGGRAGSKG